MQFEKRDGKLIVKCPICLQTEDVVVGLEKKVCKCGIKFVPNKGCLDGLNHFYGITQRQPKNDTVVPHWAPDPHRYDDDD